jgi:hypothetical protein
MIQIKGVAKATVYYLLVDSDEGLNVKTEQGIYKLWSEKKRS